MLRKHTEVAVGSICCIQVGGMLLSSARFMIGVSFMTRICLWNFPSVQAKSEGNK